MDLKSLLYLLVTLREADMERLLKKEITHEQHYVVCLALVRAEIILKRALESPKGFQEMVALFFNGNEDLK